MKKILVFAFLQLFFYSCTKDEFSPMGWGVEPELRLYPLAVVLTPNHPCDTVRIQTNYKNFYVSAPNWVEVEKIRDFPAIIVRAQSIKTNQNKREEYVTVTVARGTKHKYSQMFVVMQYKENVPFK